MSASYHFLLESTKFGTVVVVWQKWDGKTRIIRVFLAENKEKTEEMIYNNYLNAFPSSNTLILEQTQKIQNFLSGQQVDFDLNLLAFEICTPFQKRVLLAEKEIPRGHVSTYSRIAKYIGVEYGARAVGNALACNPFPIIIPCHRAIRSDLTLGGYQGGTSMKQALLEFEGIRISETGKVYKAKYYY